MPEKELGFKTVFLDRDGVINRSAKPHQYICSFEEFVFMPEAEESLARLKKNGYQLLLVTNQRGIARGMVSREQIDRLHEDMQEHLRQRHAALDGIYICPHNEGECECRKPQIGLFLQAEKNFKIDKSKAWMVGDSDSDVEAGRRYGIRTIKTTSIKEAVDKILKEDGAEL